MAQHPGLSCLNTVRQLFGTCIAAVMVAWSSAPAQAQDTTRKPASFEASLKAFCPAKNLEFLKPDALARTTDAFVGDLPPERNKKVKDLSRAGVEACAGSADELCRTAAVLGAIRFEGLSGDLARRFCELPVQCEDWFVCSEVAAAPAPAPTTPPQQATPPAAPDVTAQDMPPDEDTTAAGPSQPPPPPGPTAQLPPALPELPPPARPAPPPLPREVTPAPAPPVTAPPAPATGRRRGRSRALRWQKRGCRLLRCSGPGRWDRRRPLSHSGKAGTRPLFRRGDGALLRQPEAALEAHGRAAGRDNHAEGALHVRHPGWRGMQRRLRGRGAADAGGSPHREHPSPFRLLKRSAAFSMLTDRTSSQSGSVSGCMGGIAPRTPPGLPSHATRPASGLWPRDLPDRSGLSALLRSQFRHGDRLRLRRSFGGLAHRRLLRCPLKARPAPRAHRPSAQLASEQ